MSRFLEVSIDSLAFDKENPRLPSSVRGQREARLLDYLATETAIEKLMSSIGENGFFPGEALVAMPSNSKYIVIEGNRRLAALKLLQDPTQVSRRSIHFEAGQARHKPTIVPVFSVNTREETLEYLGFRHISGVQRWDPLAKARYLKSLFDRTKGEPNERYNFLAREIGSTSSAVRRNLDALAAYQIIQQNDFYDIADVTEESFHFGTFYTAVSNFDIANFIGSRDDATPTHPIVNADTLNTETLGELIKYCFERDSRGDTILGESRNIPKLGTVLSDSRSLTALRMGQSLDTAYRLTPHGRDDFVRHMNQAIEELKQANANLYAVDDEDQPAKDLVTEVIKIVQLASDRLGITKR